MMILPLSGLREHWSSKVDQPQLVTKLQLKQEKAGRSRSSNLVEQIKFINRS